MKARSAFLVCLLLGLMLCGCHEQAPETSAPTSPPTTQLTEATVPPTTLPPATEPERILEFGRGVFADGDQLVSGSVIYNDVEYIMLGELLAALDGAVWSGSEEQGYILERSGNRYRFEVSSPDIIVNDTAYIMNSPVLEYQACIWVPAEEICAILSISFLIDEAGGNLYCTSVGTGFNWELGVNIPILMYHGVADDTHGASELFVRPDDLDAQIAWLVENGYDLITFEDWAHLEYYDKPVMLTFDDGYRDNYENLYPILQKYQVKATVFVISGSVDIHETTLSYMQVRELAQSGLVSIQSHTYTHPHLDECDEETLHHQLLTSKLMLTRMTRYEPFVLCYPYGDRDELAIEVTQQYYRFGLAMNGGLYTTSEEVYEIPRYYVSRYTSMAEFMAMVSGAGRS